MHIMYKYIHTPTPSLSLFLSHTNTHTNTHKHRKRIRTYSHKFLCTHTGPPTKTSHKHAFQRQKTRKQDDKCAAVLTLLSLIKSVYSKPLLIDHCFTLPSLDADTSASPRSLPLSTH